MKHLWYKSENGQFNGNYFWTCMNLGCSQQVQSVVEPSIDFSPCLASAAGPDQPQGVPRDVALQERVDALEGRVAALETEAKKMKRWAIVTANVVKVLCHNSPPFVQDQIENLMQQARDAYYGEEGSVAPPGL